MIKLKKFAAYLLSIILVFSTALILPFNTSALAGDCNESGYVPDDTERLIDDSYNGGSFSGYVPDDEQRLTGDLDNTEPTPQQESVPIVLTDEQKQQITVMMKKAALYTSNDSVGNPVAPPYDEAYTSEMGKISNSIIDNGSLLLCDKGSLSQFNAINSDYARLLTLLNNPVINPQFAAYSCYLSFKEHNNNSWYSEEDWQSFVAYRNKLYEVLTSVREDYLNINGNFLTYIQKKEITAAFFNLLECYDKMTLDDALLGDVDGDGCATVLDVTAIQRNMADKIEFTEGQKLRATICAKAADNGSDYDIQSVTALQKHIVDKDTYLPSPLNVSEFSIFQLYNFPPKEIRPTHLSYPDPELLNQRQYRNISIWNPIICITNYADKRLAEIEANK